MIAFADADRPTPAPAPAPTPVRHLSCAETAKLVRAALRVAFPRVRFSVTSKTYSGGASIRVRWIDGPTMRRVEAVAGAFAGADFDGMQDLKTYRGPAVADGERVHFGADFVFCEREASDAHWQRVAALVAAHYGLEAAPARAEAHRVRVAGVGEHFDTLVWRALSDRTSLAP
jgi:hypothetical protein